MKNQLFNKRIPTIFGIGFIVLGIVLTTIIVKNQTNLKSKASNSQEPQNVKITNLSDNSFRITYQTDAATIGSVSYGETKQLGNTQLENFEPKSIHSITVEKLLPLTKYYLVISSGKNTFLNNGIPFEISTGPNLISSPSALQTVIKGKVILPDGNAPSEALIYLSADNSQLLSTTVTKDGEFNFSLKGFRANDLLSYFEFNEDTVLKLDAINNSLKSTVSFSLNQTGSIPTITLSNDYDFTKDYVPVASESAQGGFPSTTITESATPSATPTPFPTITSAPIESKGGLPPTGNSSVLLIIGGIVSAISGIALFLLTRTIL